MKTCLAKQLGQRGNEIFICSPGERRAKQICEKNTSTVTSVYMWGTETRPPVSSFRMNKM